MPGKAETYQIPSYSLVGCVGAGLSAIALGASLKRWYQIDDIRIFERQAAAGGTWYTNSYPGCACDIPSALYSFSFALNPNWTKFTPPYQEIRQYHEDVVKSYGLADKMTLCTEVYKCVWREDVSRWRLFCRNVETGQEFTHECRVLFGATGVLTTPRPCDIAGVESFKGDIFHSSEWKHDASLDDKNVVVLGNGCSAAQIVPAIVKQTKSLTQIIRSKHWVVPSANLQYPSKLKWVFRNIPFTMRLHRFQIFYAMESQFKMYRMTDDANAFRRNIQATAESYMRKAAPEKYHDILIPDFELGCKRRVSDSSGYLKSLHNENLRLTNAKSSEITPDGIKTSDGFIPADVIILATGFKTNSFASYMDMYGRNGKSLDEHWSEADGPGAYNGTAMHGFPNFFLILGPNTATGHTSTFLAIENTVNFALRLLKPVLHDDASSIEIKREAEEWYINEIQGAVQGTVFNSGCKSWYSNDKGWNSMSYPWTQANFWYRSLFPTWSDWMVKGARKKSRFQLKVAALLGILLCGNIYMVGVQNPKIWRHITYLKNLVTSYAGKMHW